MTNLEPKKDENSNSGFVFGLTLGAAVGALSAILINKNGGNEIVQNFESKIKEFFQDIIDGSNNKKESPSKKIEFIDVEEEKETSPITIKRKETPRMFVKPKR